MVSLKKQEGRETTSERIVRTEVERKRLKKQKKRVVKDGSEYSKDAKVQGRQVLLEIQQIEVIPSGAFWERSLVGAFVVGLSASMAVN